MTTITITSNNKTAAITLVAGKAAASTAKAIAQVKAGAMFKLMAEGKQIEAIKVNGPQDIKVKVDGGWMNI